MDTPIPPTDYTFISFQNDIYSINEKAEKLIIKYTNIMERNFSPEIEYHEAIINWRKEVIEFYEYLMYKKKNMYMAFYFVKKMYFYKFNVEPPEIFIDVAKIYGNLITPENRTFALIETMADDPNGYLQFVLYYSDTTRDPKIVCL